MRKVPKTVEQKKLQMSNFQEMHAMILEAYARLEKQYEESKDAQQKKLLEEFIHVINRVSDEVLLESEKLMSVDREKMKQEKCENYEEDILFYKLECQALSNKLKQANTELLKEKQYRRKVQHQIQNLEILRRKKDRELHSIIGKQKLRIKLDSSARGSKSMSYCMDSPGKITRAENSQIKIESTLNLLESAPRISRANRRRNFTHFQKSPGILGIVL